MAEVEQVIGAVFQYIDMLKKQGPDERIWKEIQAIEDMSFRYVEDSPPVENVESLSEQMHKYAPVDYITGDCLISEFNSDVSLTVITYYYFTDFYPFFPNFKVILKCINALEMSTVNIMLLSKDFENSSTCNQIEPWFQTRYDAKGNLTSNTS